jgi:hypothetical protein
MEPGEKKNSKGESGNGGANFGDIFQPLGVRCTVRSGHEIDRLLLENGRGFLFHVGILFWLVLFLTQKK